SFLIHAPAPADVYALSLHDALPILTPRGMCFIFSCTDLITIVSTMVVSIASVSIAILSTCVGGGMVSWALRIWKQPINKVARNADRKSTRLNSSHVKISYAVFCLKK